MTCADRQYEKLFRLLDDWCDGSLGAKQIEQLDRMLCDDPAARWQYLCYMNVHGGLGLSSIKVLNPVAGGLAEGDTPAVPPRRFALPRPLSVLDFLGGTARWTREYFSQPVPFSMLTAAIFMVCVVAILNILPAPTYKPGPSNHACNTTSSTGLRPVDRDRNVDGKFNFVARITGKHNCRWSLEGRAPIRYDHLGLGRELKLDAGIVEITYYNGAKVVLEGPVEFTVEEPNACRLDLGKLTANVSEKAVGFTVETPTATIVDLGTEFGVEVEQGGDADVRVFKGVVNMTGQSGRSRRITAGQAARVNLSGRFVAPKQTETQFVRKLPRPAWSGPIAHYIADSREDFEDFSGTQGQGNWYYGYYEIENPVAYDATPDGTDDFVQLADEYWDGSFWSRTGDGWWIQFRGYSAHPDESRWAVRRWVSKVSSSVTIYWHISKSNIHDGNGVIGRIFHNGGDAIDSATVAFDDTTGYNKSVTVTVAAGDYIDLALDAGNGDCNCDATNFYAIITAVPEPSKHDEERKEGNE